MDLGEKDVVLAVMEVYGRLLGVPRLRLAHTGFEPPLTKATTLLYYLAYRGSGAAVTSFPSRYCRGRRQKQLKAA
jgi:hypothetical protein